MSDEDEALKAAKIQRRSAKASLTRLGKALVQLCDNKRPVNEVSEYLVKVKEAFENVVSKHETYANLIVDDKEFEKEENWLDECQNYFLKIDIDAKGYIEHEHPENQQQSSGMTGMIGIQNADSASNMNPLVTEETQQSAGDEVNDVNDGPPIENSSESFNTVAEVTPNNLEQSPSQIASQSEVKSALGTVQKSNPCSFQIEKPKLP